MKKFYEILKETMQEKGISQNELAQKLGVKQGSISNWVTGRREPDFDMFMRICFYLEEDPTYMLGYKEVEIRDQEESAQRVEEIRRKANRETAAQELSNIVLTKAAGGIADPNYNVNEAVIDIAENHIDELFELFGLPEDKKESFKEYVEKAKEPYKK